MVEVAICAVTTFQEQCQTVFRATVSLALFSLKQRIIKQLLESV